MARKLQVEILGSSKDLERAFGKAAGASSGFGSKMASVGRVAGIALAALGTGAVFAGKKMISMASDAGEVDSKMQVVFGKALPELTKNLDKFSEVTGASRFALREQAADMGALLEPLTKNKKGAADMSAQFVKLATDLGSFNNVPVADALLAIRSGLVGEAEPLRRFGVLLNEAAVSAEGVRLGLIKTGEAMTEQEKVQARASLIMQQTSLAQGDATRTAGSMANQMKELRNNVSDAATSLGTMLIPHALAAVKAFNDNWPAIQMIVQKVMTQVVSVIGSVVGTIRSHWDQISNLGKASFTALVGTIRMVANFLRSDLGQAMAAGVVGAFAFAKGMAAITTAVSAAKVAILAFSANPIVLGLGLIAGVAAMKLIPALMSSSSQFQSFEGAARAAKGAIDALKFSMDTLKQAHLNVEIAQLRLKETTARVTESQNLYGAAVDAHGRKSPQAVAAYRDVQRAILDKKQALLDTKRAVDEEGEATTKRAQELAGPMNAVKKFSDSYGVLATSLKSVDKPGQTFNERMASGLALMTQDEKVDTYTRAMHNFAIENLKAAAALDKTDPAAAKAQRATGLFALEIVGLTTKLGRMPTKQEFAFIVKHGVPAFLEQLGRLAPESSAAGKKATSALERGLAPMSDKAGAEAGRAVGAVRGQAGAASGAGFSVGQSAVSGIVAGLRSMWGAVQSAASSIISVVAGALRAKARIGSPAGLTRDEVGIPLAQGLIEGFTQYLVANGAKIADATKQATQIVAQVLPSIQAAGRVLGLEKARAIAAGIIQGTPSLAQQMKTALRTAVAEALAAAATKVREAKDAFSSAFSELSSAALAAFDSQVAKWESPTRKLMEKLRLKETAQQLNEAIGSATEGVAQAKKALGEALTAEGAPIKEGADPVAEMAQRQEAIKRAQEQIVAAEATLLQAQRAKRDFALEQAAVKEEEAHAKLMEKKRVQFENQLAQLQNQLARHPKEHAKIQQQILDLLDTYVPGFRLKGEKIGFAIAEGIRESIAGVKAAFREMLEAVNGQEVVKKAAKAGAKAASVATVPRGGIGPNVAMAGITVNLNVNVGTLIGDDKRRVADELAADMDRALAARGLRVGRTQLSTSY